MVNTLHSARGRVFTFGHWEQKLKKRKKERKELKMTPNCCHQDLGIVSKFHGIPVPVWGKTKTSPENLIRLGRQEHLASETCAIAVG